MPFLNPHNEIDMHTNHLPHWQQGDVFVFATWRLADSFPREKLEEWAAEKAAWLKHHPKPWDGKIEQEYHRRFSRTMDEWLDQGSGSCVLQDSENAKTVADALHHFAGERYGLDSFVVMPNHVHVLFCPTGNHLLSDIVQSWKGFAAREINKRLGAKGPLWQEDYWDRLVRNEKHYSKCREYIRENPAKAKLREGQFGWFEK
jgi:REP element-mobilizing transposase RayT